MEASNGNPNKRIWWWLTGLAVVAGGWLVIDAARSSSATYDEVTYLRVAARWWRTGDQEAITRMGSPLGFWKYQQAPTLWAIDRSGLGRWIDEPDRYQAAMLPVMRAGSIWIWAAALVVTAAWARRLHGPSAMALAAWLFALSPNLIAHGSLVTMEMPLIAWAAASALLFSIFLESGQRWAFASSAVLAGLAFTCKFTAILIPILCGVCWLVREVAARRRSLARSLWRTSKGMMGFLAVFVATDLLLTGFARLPLSERTGDHPSLAGSSTFVGWLIETPIPQDWVGFATQIRHQRSGGPSYLFGERRTTGWRHYYFVAMAAKVPPIFWLMVMARLALGRRGDSLLLVAIGTYLGLAALGSTRNYGVRYVLPVAPLAIVWVSALAEGGRWARAITVLGITGFAVAVATTHPRELSYFPSFVGGAKGGRLILSDSNLDWGQGLRDLARLQRQRPELGDLTLYYFGLAEPSAYGVEGRSYVVDAGDDHRDLPAQFAAETRYVAVSASLQFGPWGPPGYFEALRGVEPVAALPDWSIAIYDVRAIP